MTRPHHAQIINELGRKQSMPAGVSYFTTQKRGADVIFMSLGPQPKDLPHWFPTTGTTYYVESPEFESQMDVAWANDIPADYQRLTPAELSKKNLSTATIVRYTPSMRAFPGFWGPLLAQSTLAQPHPAKSDQAIWIPSDSHALLTKELSHAFAQAGYTVRLLDAKPLAQAPEKVLPTLLQQERPALYLAVNGKGLDPYGMGYHLLREAGCEVALWLVDNPFNIFTLFRSKFWQEAFLFTTDASYIPLLHKHGAQRATFLPLAASPELFVSTAPLPFHAQNIGQAAVFVGRSEFPDKEQYFAGQALCEKDRLTCKAMLAKGLRPDFHWWRAKQEAPSLWPGNTVRALSYAAEEASKAWRTMCLKKLDSLIVFGDENWSTLLPKADTRAPVDYYAGLAAIYKNAHISLNMTSMQLPAALTQRHFDVWSAGGFLLTDNTPGMNLFPKDMAKEVTFNMPQDITALQEHFKAYPAHQEELRRAWQALIAEEHTMEHRIKTLLTTIGMN